MISAEEAAKMMDEANRFKDELKNNIEPYIKEAARKGNGHVILYVISPYCSKTIDELKKLGYKVSSFKGYKGCPFSYYIEWAIDD